MSNGSASGRSIRYRGYLRLSLGGGALAHSIPRSPQILYSLAARDILILTRSLSLAHS